MFALPADLSLRLAHQRMADDRDKAAQHDRAQAARRWSLADLRRS